MKRPLALVGTLAVTAGLLAGTMVAPTLAGASSHREAPGISTDPSADNTDVYAFVSPDKPDTVTLIANYIPMQDPAGGPNFNSFSDNVLYAINIDNVGDAEDHITYQFQFKTGLRNRNSFLYNTGQLTSPEDPDWNLPQTYRVTRVENGKSKAIGWDLTVPPVNVGKRSTPDYEAQIGSKGVHPLDNGGMVFAGQRDDPFFVDLGSIFDLGGLRPFNSFHVIPLPNAPGIDALRAMNVHSIALQVPITDLTVDHQKPTWRRRPTRDHRRLRQRQPTADDRAARGRQRPRVRAVGPGVAVGRAADQRGDHPARREGPLESIRARRRRRALPELLQDAGAGRSDQLAVPGLAGCADHRSTRPEHRAAHGYPGLEPARRTWSSRTSCD